jgi:hypothetical protein
MKEFNVKQLQQIRFEIEGKAVVNQQTGERTVEMEGILKRKEFSQKEKTEFRKLSKKIEEIVKVIGEQEKALYEEFVDNFGTSEAKFKEGADKDDLKKQLEDLYSSTHKIEKVEGVEVSRILDITGTSDYYELLEELQK